MQTTRLIKSSFFCSLIYIFSIFFNTINLSYADSDLTTSKDYYYLSSKVASRVKVNPNNYDVFLKIIDTRLTNINVNDTNYKQALIFLDLKAYILQLKLDLNTNNSISSQSDNSISSQSDNVEITQKLLEKPIEKTIEKPIETPQQKPIEQPKIAEPVKQEVVIPKVDTTTQATTKLTICDMGCDLSTSENYLDLVIENVLNTYKSKVDIILKEGVYNLKNSINVNNDNITIEGQGDKSKIVILGAKGKDVIGWRGDNGALKNITIDAEKNNSLVAFSSADVNYFLMDNLIIKGSKTSFVVFFSGPNHESNMDYTDTKSPYYLYANNILNKGNKIYNSEIYANNTYDSLVMALNDNGEIKNNVIQGKISYYMSQNGVIEGNLFKHSMSDALYLSGPVKNIIVKDNNFQDILGSAIVLSAQREHKIPDGLAFENINITSNTIDNINYFGMTLNNMKGGSIKNNKINSTGGAGIYLQGTPSNPSIGVLVEGNTIQNPRQISDPAYSKVWGAGIGLENTDTIYLYSNNISDTNGTLYYGIYSWKNQNKNTIIDKNVIVNSKINEVFQ